MSPKKLAELTHKQLRREILKTAVTCLVFTATIVGTYFTLPFDSLKWDGQAVTRMLVGLVLFGIVLTFFIRRILASEIPQLRAAETLIISLAFFLCFYASVYLEISNHNPQTFNQVLSHSSALYFTIVTFGTVGFGDISANSDLARLLVSAQIILDVVFIAALAKSVVFASQFTLKRDSEGSES